MPGYSPRSLVQKLGVRPDTRIVALGAPADYPKLLGALPPGVTIQTRLPARARFIHQFSRSRAELEAGLARAARALADDGTLWVSWPKKASGVATGLTESSVRAAALPLGLVDVKVCAVDEVWSGLKLVRRKELRV